MEREKKGFTHFLALVCCACWRCLPDGPLLLVTGSRSGWRHRSQMDLARDFDFPSHVELITETSWYTFIDIAQSHKWQIDFCFEDSYPSSCVETCSIQCCSTCFSVSHFIWRIKNIWVTAVNLQTHCSHRCYSLLFFLWFSFIHTVSSQKVNVALAQRH